MHELSMNGRMARVFGAIMVAFAAIILLLTWWQLIAAPELRQKDYNNQTAYYEQRIKRGFVTSRDGVVLARNRAKPAENGDTIWRRRYPTGGLAAHVVGYSTFGKSRTGIERSFNDALTGSTRGLAGLTTKLQGQEDVRGDAVRLTIDASAQRIARQALGSRKGAVVAIEPATGRILVLASSPTFDPNSVEDNFGAITRAPGEPLVNRATQGRYPPGSTFKVVTATAALEGGMAPTQTFPGGSSVEVDSGPPISNFGNTSYGSHDLTFALTNSVNTTFARLGDELGQEKLREQMERFGFFESPLVDDLPADEQRASGLYGPEGLLDAEEGLDPARVAIGQERLQVTPMQMALVVATIANRGRGMEPYVVEQVTSPDGRVEQRAEPDPRDDPAMSPGTADALSRMMQNVVKEGTGTAAALQGIDVAGKTGTADTPSGNQVWFVGFAPAADPQVAIAVTLESQPEGTFGGTAAAPIARDVIEDLLRER